MFSRIQAAVRPIKLLRSRHRLRSDINHVGCTRYSIKPELDHMLTLPPLPASGAPTRCTVSLHLRSYVKTTDGDGSLDFGAYDYGSFAMAIV